MRMGMRLFLNILLRVQSLEPSSTVSAGCCCLCPRVFRPLLTILPNWSIVAPETKGMIFVMSLRYDVAFAETQRNFDQ